MSNNSAIIAVRVDLDQHEIIKRTARRVGLPMSTFLRVAALKESERIKLTADTEGETA